jgi:hypothetical protein
MAQKDAFSYYLRQRPEVVVGHAKLLRLHPGRHPERAVGVKRRVESVDDPVVL